MRMRHALQLPRLLTVNVHGAHTESVLICFSLWFLTEVSDLPVGVGRIMRNAPSDRKVKVAILSIGTRLVEAMRAARMLVRVFPVLLCFMT
jgi:hypothetical protein